jgi:hypothetical protein
VTHSRAVAEVAATVRREAFVMAYSDCSFVMGIALVVHFCAGDHSAADADDGASSFADQTTCR